MALPPTNKRVKTLSICRPILWGNTAKPLGDVRPEGTPTEHTHSWTVFVRGPKGEDLSYFIKKVVFKLHETYNNSTRSIESPPFEVTETGWGEFEVGVKIFFVAEANEKNLSLYHQLKLHPYGLPEGTEVTDELKAYVESVQYDEIVFNEPTEQLFQIMTEQAGNLVPETKEESVYSRETEREEMIRCDVALKKVNLEVEKMKKKIAEYQQIKAEMS